VTNTGDNGGVNPAPGAGTGTLRQAIVDAGAAGTDTTASPDLIQFNIPTSDVGYNSTTGAFTIQPLSALPAVTDAVTIDGYTQPGASPNTLAVGDNAVLKIVLDGSLAGAVDGLVIVGGGSTVRGLVINTFATGVDGGGIVVNGGGNDVITGDFIGTDVTGESAAANGNGISINAPNNTIGGTAAAARNILSGNTYYGVAVLGVNNLGNNNLVEGNYIGTDATGEIALGNGYDGVAIGTTNNNTIGGTDAGAGNVISGTPDNANVDSQDGGCGILLGGTGNLIQGNYIGTDATGTISLGNFLAGVTVYEGNSNTIGGTTAAARNIISGNGTPSNPGIGVVLTHGSSGNLVEGDFIGTDVTGTHLLPNAYSGVFITGGANGNTVGGVSTLSNGRLVGAGNLIDGASPGDAGVFVTTNQNLIAGNFIGTDVTGTRPLGNYLGVRVGLGSSNTIGGTAVGMGNLISGNGSGILIGDGSATANLVEGNLIGTDITGTQPLGNSTAGVQITTSGNTVGGTAAGAGNVIAAGEYGIILGASNVVQGNWIGTDPAGSTLLGNSADGIFVEAGSNTIGGTAVGAGNTIAFNRGDGADVESGTGNSILGNAIFSNAGPGIRLNSANNANDNQAAPLLTSASSSSTGTTINGTLASVPDTAFRLEFFANAGLDASGNAEGETYLGFATVTTDNSGHATFTAANLAAIPAGEGYLTATATVSTLNPDGTSTYGDTSPFSNDLAVPTSLQLTSSANPSLVGLPVTFTATLSASFPGFGTPTGSVEFVDSTTNTNLGTVPLSGGIASLTTSSLAVGTHVISAIYVGGGLFLSSSASLTQTVLPPASLSGIVWQDFNDDGQVDFGEPGISGVQITLTGTDDLGNAVNLSQPTDGDGAYVFLNLRPGSYYITETPPAGYLQGFDSIGTAGGSLAATDQFFVQLAAGVNGLNYNFGELPTATGSVQKGQTATIGFWNNNNGQALIKAFNGGTGTQLADWLAATLPNMFGVNAGGNNLTGKSNAYVAALFQQDFLLKGVKLDAQVLATALSVYATNATLDSTAVAAPYGFIVSGDGVGTAAVNVGSNGDAFGVANSTTMTVMDLLLATDNQAINGLLYGGSATKRNEANNVYSGINQGGNIS
jgi:hypothetical protein